MRFKGENWPSLLILHAIIPLSIQTCPAKHGKLEGLALSCAEAFLASTSIDVCRIWQWNCMHLAFCCRNIRWTAALYCLNHAFASCKVMFGLWQNPVPPSAHMFNNATSRWKGHVLDDMKMQWPGMNLGRKANSSVPVSMRKDWQNLKPRSLQKGFFRSTLAEATTSQQQQLIHRQIQV